MLSARRVKMRMRGFYSYIGVVVGTVIVAGALNWFMIPNGLAAGGVSGLGIILHHLLDLPVGLTMLVMNIPLLLIGLRLFGRDFGVKTVLGSVALSVAVDVLAPYMGALTKDLTLAAVYGGALSGLGLGITFKYGGTTGGTDIAASILGKYTVLTTGQSLLIMDFAIITGVGFVFGPETALYALLTLFVSSKIVDGVQEGVSYAKAGFIISDHADEIADAILVEMDRGVTYLFGMGAYSKKERQVLLCVVSRIEVATLKRLVHTHDAKAFVIIADVREVLGEGFKSIAHV
jgi:uncharacterized membrane-anchored protein YitT (DUF2179 family)